MIHVVISDDCPHCETQIANMSSFGEEEFRVIKIGSSEFDSFPLKSMVDAVPFVSVTDGDAVKYAASGAVPAPLLRRIARSPVTPPFNLKNSKGSS